MHYRVTNGRLLDLAINILKEAGVIDFDEDTFGPPLIIPDDYFSLGWRNSLGTDSPVYRRYTQGGDQWLLSALDGLARQAERLGIQESDYDNPDGEWTPIPIDRTQEETIALIEAVDDTAEKLRSDNGYSAFKAEERNYVVDSLLAFGKRMREAATTSFPFIRQYALEPLARAAKALGRSATGLAVEVLKAKIKEWLMKQGIPWPPS